MTTENELGMEGLTPEERAALAEPDTDSTTATQGELEEQAAASGNNEPGEGDGADGKGKNTGGDDTGAAAAAGGDAGTTGKDAGTQAAAAAAEPGQPASAPQSAPILVAEAPADADAKLAEIKAKKDDVINRFDDGDITAKEMQAELDTLGKEERTIERAIDKAQIATDLEEQRKRNEWSGQCNEFLSRPEHAEYEGGKGERFEHLNETLMALAKMPRNAGLTGPELLAKAHTLVKAERGEAVTPAATAKGKQQVIPKPALPPNLAGVPSAASNDPGEGKYASLDRLQTANPEGYEAALAKMSDAERDAYLTA